MESADEKGLDILAIEALPVFCDGCHGIALDLEPWAECPNCGRAEPERVSLTDYTNHLRRVISKQVYFGRQFGWQASRMKEAGEAEEEAEKLAAWCAKQEKLVADYFKQVPGADTEANRTEFLRNMKRHVRQFEKKVLVK